MVMVPAYMKKTEQILPEMSKGLKKVAHFFMNDPVPFAIYPAKKIGEIIGVSETMVIRFCNAIGYDFSLLQEEIRQDLLKINQKSLELFFERNSKNGQQFDSMQRDIVLLEKNAQRLNCDEIKRAADIILHSEKNIIIGYYQSFAFAHWLYFNLNYVHKNTVLYRPESDANLLDSAPEKTCLIVFSFYRYALEPIKIAKKAKEKGFRVIAITDSSVAPITNHADISIVIYLGNSFSFFQIGPIALSVTNVILDEVAKNTPDIKKKDELFNYFITQRNENSGE